MAAVATTADPPQYIPRKNERCWNLHVLFTGAKVVLNREVETLSAEQPLEIGRAALPGRMILPDDAVSASHASVRCTPTGQWQIRDEDSRHGTFVDGKRVRGDWMPIGDGSLVALGGSLLMLCHDGSLAQSEPLGAIEGDSFAARRMFQQLRRAAASDLTALVTGPMGAGKELCARALHHEGARRRGPFVEVNCATFERSLVDSELFGHAKGAFTGADQAKRGLFQQADSGTLFLDEIGELALDIQTKLLRVLETRTIRPVGSSSAATPVDVRVIAATNRDLEAEVAAGHFRADLYHRLEQLRIDVPSLRERRVDIPRIAASLAGSEARRLTFFIVQALCRYDWPGNVRELVNFVRGVLLCDSEDAQQELDDFILRHVPSELVEGAESGLQQLTPDALISLLRSHGGNTTQIAAKLGCSRRALGRRLQEFAIRADQYRP